MEDRRITANLIGVLLLGACLLASCAPEQEEIASGATTPPAGPVRLSDLPAQVTKTADVADLEEVFNLLERDVVRIDGEAVASESWRVAEGFAGGAQFSIYRSEPLHRLITVPGAANSGLLLTHPQRTPKVWDPHLESLAPGHYAVSDGGVYLVMEKGAHPGSEYRLSYASTQAAFPRLHALHHTVQQHEPEWQPVDLGSDRRIAQLLPPPRRLEWDSRDLGRGRLELAWGFTSDRFEARNAGIRRLRAEDASPLLRIGVTRSGVEEVLWEEVRHYKERERFHAIALEVDLLDSEKLWVESGMSGAEENKSRLIYLGRPLWIPADLPPADAQPNVLMICIDTLRPDFLGCYGSTAGYTPHLDRLAASGVLFENARSTSPWTLPAHASLFTSLAPSQHGALTYREALAAEYRTLAGHLRSAGWSTAAFTDGGFLSPIYGLSSGFGRFDSTGGGAAPVLDRALHWMRSTPGRFFAFVHTYEVHSPYAPPAEYLARFVHADRGRVPEGPIDIDAFAARLIAEGSRATEEELRYCREMYGAGLAYADAEFGKFFAALGTDERFANTLIIVTSDHGEEFLEHGDFGHSHTLYDEVLRIPLLLQHPQRYQGGTRFAHRVGLEDLPTTVVEFLDLPKPAEWEGLPVLVDAPRPFLAMLKTQRGLEAYASCSGDHTKWIFTPEGFYRTPRRSGWECYETETDRLEQQDRFDESQRDALQQELQSLRTRFAERGADGAEVQASAALLEQLRAFGYLVGK